MEYNDNGFFNSEPQKPITEKEHYESPVQPENAGKNDDGFQPPVSPQDSFIPQNPFEQPAQSEAPKPKTDYQPQYTGYYQTPPQYYGYQQQYNPVQQPLQGEPQPAQNAGPYYQGYGNPQTPYYGGYAPQPNAPQGYNAPNGYGIPNPPATYGYGQPNLNAQPPKQKASGGLIAVIIILCILLIGSFAGILIYIASNTNENASAGFGNGNEFVITIPDNDIIQTYPHQIEQPTTQPSTQAPVNDQSDYSDKINKNYKGLTINSKPKDAKTSNKYNSEYAYSQVSESVIGVLCYTEEPKDNTAIASQGSGIIISEDGYAITNSHVINNSKTAYAIRVRMLDGKEYKAGVVGFDSRTDLALLKIDGVKNLKAASIGNAKEVELGEDIIVVGNPGGIEYQNSITKGIVSALDRETSDKSLVKYIQTDAAINPGNSGGPLVNMYGQVIGVASSKIVSEQYEGMGFAIPTDTTKTIIDSLMKFGYVDGRVKIGISGYALTAMDSAQYGIPQGMYVQDIQSEGPCDGVISAGDVIIEADGERITSFSDIYSVLENHKVGDKIKLKVFKGDNGQTKEAEITLQADK